MFDRAYMKDRRRRLGFTQQELADKVGVNQQAIHKWEAGANIPRGQNVEKLAAALQISPDILFPESMQSRDPSNTLSAIRGVMASSMTPEEKINMIEKLLEEKR